MKQKLALFFALFAAVVIVFSCSNEDDKSGNPHTNSIIGTWKLVEVYENNTAVDLSSCDLMETYIFGAEQFSNTLYGSNGEGFDFNSQFRGDAEEPRGTNRLCAERLRRCPGDLRRAGVPHREGSQYL